MYDKFSIVLDDLTSALLAKYKECITKDELRAFLKVQVERTVCKSILTFLNVPSVIEDKLIIHCTKNGNTKPKDRHMVQSPLSLTFLEPELYSG